MRILFTGSSSFTGYWFIKALVQAGHTVFATFQGKDYDGIRGKRVEELRLITPCYFEAAFGSEAFLKLIEESLSLDMICHHAADVRDYKNPNFDVMRALHSNTFNIQQVFNKLKDVNCQKVLFTSSVFEQNTGEGTEPLHAFSPYGLSKGLTFEMIRYYAYLYEFTLGRFVIPNPFGPMEEPRFTTYLAKEWLAGRTPSVATPLYIRDNIPIDLLAQSYRLFAEQLHASEENLHLAPSGYATSQGNFAKKLAAELQQRWNIPCELNIKEQVSFNEPLKRINKDSLTHLEWSESDFYDSFAAYHLGQSKILT